MTRLTPAPLLGRTTELQHLRQLLSTAAAGTGHAVLVEGEPGIGKTMLLEVLADDADHQGLQVFSGAAEEMERDLPFAAAASCLDLTPTSTDARRAALAHQMRKELSTAGLAGPGHLHLIEPILALVNTLCTNHAALMIVDNLHWVDQATMQVLHHLGKTLHRLPLLLVTASRPTTRSSLLGPLRRSVLDHGATVLSLPPLDGTATRELAAQLLETRPGPRLSGLLEACGGNPRHIRELIDQLRHDGLQLTDEVADVASEHLPELVRETVLRRLDLLPVDTLQVLRAAALLGSNATAEDLAALTGRTPTDVVRTMFGAIDAGVLTERDGRLTFTLDLVRQGLYQGLPAEIRAAMHLEAGLALGAAGAPLERVVEHLVAGTPSGSPRLLAWLYDHATALIARLPDTAITLLERAVRLATPTDARLGSLRVHLADALLQAGRADEAEHHAQQALARHPDPATQISARWVLAGACFARGRPDLAAGTAMHALEHLALAPGDTARFEAFGSMALFTMGEMTDAENLARQAMASAAPLGEVDALMTAHTTLAAIHHHRGDPATALDLVERAFHYVQGADVAGDKLIALHLVRAYCLLDLLQPNEAEQAIAQAHTIAEDRWPSRLPDCRFARAFLLFATGHWDAARDEIQVGLDLPTSWMTRALHGLAAVIAIHRQDSTTARTHLTAAEHAVPTSSAATFFEFLLPWAQRLYDQANHKPGQGIQRYIDWLRTQPPALRRQQVWLAPGAVGLALAAGRRDLAEELTLEVEARMADGGAAPGTLAAARHCRGLLEQAPDLLRSAAHAYERIPWVLFRAHYQEDLAAVLAAAGRHTEAKQALDTAMDSYARLGASWNTVRAAARLRTLGVHRGAREGRRRAATGWDSLTPAESQVADLVAQGLSNPAVAARLFVSRRTVQTHVSNILAKLGLKSRVELAAAFTQRRRRRT
ncbi:LuxR family transcriptional regulator [Longimycelium tulufanense]|uniref:LuxR family transcriptional regulator n=1 Tax=Longimycelium tulufanense TaxID=907463 RepID=A0A8J3CCJ5_9PSEU|nr:AAA family ATPase [Longimycelium tulufanense]GGM48999.1 LuxR family transcriptional regulator [Longimycelium tulufanense]